MSFVIKDEFFIESEDGEEFVVGGLIESDHIIEINREEFEKFLDEFNSLGHISFTITPEQIQSVIEQFLKEK